MGDDIARAPADPVGVAMVGNGFMGRAHTLALVVAGLLVPDLPPVKLRSISGRDPGRTRRSAAQYRYREAFTDWRAQLDGPGLSAVDVVLPTELHHAATMAAIGAGHAVLCEKPLAATAADAYEMWQAAEAAGVVHMCGFNFRFAPAVRLAHDLVVAGEIGEVVAFDGSFLESIGLPDHDADDVAVWPPPPQDGALLGLGPHILDLALWFAGEPTTVQAQRGKLNPAPTVRDDFFSGTLQFRSGAHGTVRGSRVAGGVTSECRFTVTGTKGALRWESPRLNELWSITPGHRATLIEVTRPTDPFMAMWWPEPGHPISWTETFTHQAAHFLRAVAGGTSVRESAADFEDGYRCALVVDALSAAADSGRPTALARPEG
ncbi:Gfo/Idh/MocA family oxidoreductase [Micromonospora rifamycinica]|uniref:Gfo/Idh/MocA family protein n=1 Tax=Micromonospora rifamycinica TaxID=291594 RepID=UPI0033F112DB